MCVCVSVLWRLYPLAHSIASCRFPFFVGVLRAHDFFLSSLTVCPPYSGLFPYFWHSITVKTMHFTARNNLYSHKNTIFKDKHQYENKTWKSDCTHSVNGIGFDTNQQEFFLKCVWIKKSALRLTQFNCKKRLKWKIDFVLWMKEQFHYCRFLCSN